MRRTAPALPPSEDRAAHRVPSRTRSSAKLNAVARYLDGLRQIADVTFAELAARVARLGDPRLMVSAATLKRASSGLTVPKETTVIAFVRGVLGDEDDYTEHLALRLWRMARAEERGLLSTLKAPSVGKIRTHADLAAALAAAYEEAGAPPLRALRQRAGTDTLDGAHLLPLSTAWRITRREAQPADWRQCEAFLRGCGIHQRRMDQWRQAWNRTAATERRAPARRRPPQPNITSLAEPSSLGPATGPRIAGTGAVSPGRTGMRAWGAISVRPVETGSSEQIPMRVRADLARLLDQLPDHDRDAALVLALTHLGKYPPARHGSDVALVEGRTDGHRDRPRLSPREAQILTLVASGLPHKGIAKELGCSVSTVASHLARVRMQYLGTGHQFRGAVDYMRWASYSSAGPQ
ncbi:response regulator transcription factor [Streptomyces sp. MMG1522]|uniref:response regulator transcription factor n=1 Tax=Streptomyces sp. MMG1522 TaxID=1415545 RepID=UPI0006B033DF|nr:sigma factor-like helix-turn-helix DNA-binding protein [Streptomyces sp. MMG1522]